MLRKHAILLVAGSLLATAILPGVKPAKAEVGIQHYLYACPGYAHDPGTGRYSVPSDCRANPYEAPGTHTWLTRQVPVVLSGDGHGKQVAQLGGIVRGGYGRGSKTRLQALTDGVIVADTRLSGCTAYGRSIGWPIGDHMTNPYRHFGVWSYYQQPRAGWQGYGYVSSQGRRSGQCAKAPRVRTKSAFAANEFFNRAVRSWKQSRSGDAMYNLGIALHMMQDAAVPSHAHPEVNVGTLRIRNPRGEIVDGQDVFPAWSNVHKDEHAITSNGRYQLPATINGVSLSRTASGFVYAMAATAHPYFPYNEQTSATAPSTYRCDVTNFPEDCATESAYLLREAQRNSAGVVNLFFERIGYKQ
ncbi:MAG: hypothetical protein Q8Q11_01910 [bacterium]|nr:hypothetical protein [bacterium]MDZ4247668.1 hypothetical protein [Patescibacteria group bacterium]